MKPISYARHRFPPDVIQHAVWLYLRFTLSYRDVEDLLAERGLEVSNGRRMYMWRAVDSEGEVLDVLVQTKRNRAAALKLMRKLLKKYCFLPDKMVTDDLRSYGAAHAFRAGAFRPRAKAGLRVEFHPRPEIQTNIRRMNGGYDDGVHEQG